MQTFSFNSTLVKYMLTRVCLAIEKKKEKKIELKQCLSYTMWISTHMTDGILGCQDNWTLILLPFGGGASGGGGGGDGGR